MTRRLAVFAVGLALLAPLALDWVQDQVAAPLPAPGAPEVYMLNAQIEQYDEGGRLQYRTQAARFTHLPGSGLINMAAPEVQLAGEGQGWRIKAADGRILQGGRHQGERLELWGGVQAALEAERQAPLRIQAQAAMVNERTGVSTYEGQVVVTQGSLKMTAETVEIHTAQQALAQVIASAPPGAAPARYEQQLDEAGAKVTAQARTITYLAQEGRVWLAGDARLSQAGDAFAGELLRYDLEQRAVRLAGGAPDGRVKLQLAPRDGD